MMAIDMLNTDPKRIKIARYPVKFFARSAQTLLNSVSLAGTTTQPLIDPPAQKVKIARNTMPRPSHTDHQSSVFHNFSTSLPLMTSSFLQENLFLSCLCTVY